MEEVKQYHRNLAVAFYDYKKAYDIVHHDWMLRVHKWIGIPKDVTELIYQLISKWKTRLEIWKEREKFSADGLKSCVGFYKEIVTHPLGFAYLRYRYASYYSKAKATGWENLETEM